MRWYRERVVDRVPDAPAVDDITGMVERDALCEHLLALPAKQRAVLVLRYYEGMAEAEIAEILGISRGTVKSHTSRALAALRRRLTDEDDRTVVHR
jgi:RNA polymerase sigma factor (sigma-70 family)